MMPVPAERPLFAEYSNGDNETRRVRVSQLTPECASVAIQLAEEPDTSWESGNLVHGGSNEQGELVVHRKDSAARPARLKKAHKALKKKVEERCVDNEI
ncbi:hypothetical protein MKEN_01429400 [Mycena kentingensis (nom. inval.)]|nr:hypothetical protein MKEN_01429400 [Mycena kentingensis (nom. inval.)]